MADKEVRVRITGDMSDLLGKLDQLEDAFNDLGKERINNTSVNDLIDDYQRLNKEAREYNENLDDFRGSQRRLDNGNISDMTKQYSDASKHLEKYTDQVKDFVREASSMDDFMSFDDIDNTIGNIGNITEELGKAKETINDIVSSSGNIRIDADGNIKRDTSNLSNALGIGAGAGMVMASSMNKVADSVKETGNALQELSGAGEKNLKELVDHYDKLYKKMDKATERIRELNNLIYKDEENGEYGELISELSSVESQIDCTKWVMEDLNKEMEKNRKIIEGNTTSINKQSNKIKEYQAAIEELKNTESDNSKEIEEMSKTRKEYADRIEETRKKIEDLQKTMNSQHENSLEGQIEKIREEMKKYQQIMNDITDESGDWGSVLVSGNLESAITKINKCLEEYLEITKKVNDEQDKAKNTDNIEDQIKAYKDLLDVYEEAQKKIQAMDSSTMLARFDLDDEIGNFENAIERATDRLEEFKEELNSGDLDDAGIERVTKQIKEIEERIKSYMDSIEKFNSIKLNSKSFIDEFRAGDYTIIIDNIEKLKKALVDLEEHKEVDLDLDFDDMTKSLEGAIDAYNKYLSSFDEFNSYSDKYKEARNEYYKYYREEKKLLEEQKKAFKEAGGFLGEWARQAKIAHGNKDLLTDSEKTEAEIEKLTKALKSYEEALKTVDDTLDLLNHDATAEEIEKYNEAIERSKQLMDKAIDKMLEYVQKNADLGNELKRRENDLDELNSEYKDLSAEISKLQRELNKEQQALGDGNKELSEKLKELEKQSNLYTVLRRDVEKFLKSEENGIIAKERLAKAFEKVTDSMKDMNNEIKETDKLPDDLLEKVYKDAEQLRKSLDLVDFDLLKEGLNSLGTAINDKTDKLKNFNQINKELSDTSRAVMLSLEKQGKSIKDFADGAGYALELFKDKSIGIIGNEKALERQRQLIDENAEAIKKFLKQIEDAGGKIPDRFLGEDGLFDEFKYLKELENFGAPLNQLIAQAKSYRQEILESLKHEKESIENKRKLAKETLELAQANQKAAEAQMDAAKQAEKEATTMEEQAQAYAKIKKAKAELTKTTEELLKAAKDYADINDKSTDEKRIQNAKDLVEQYNKQAEALRKLGAAVKDIELDDIKKFDKSLGTLLKDVFPDDDVPKKLRDYMEDIKAAFTELGDLEFGNFGDIMKDIGKGLLDALPKGFKEAAVAIGTVTTALYKLYEAGKQQFFEGLSNIGNKLQPVLELVRDFGQEVVSAFESITDTDIDLSSLMELGPNFEYNMQKVGAIAGSNKRQLEELTKTAEVLGGTTQYTASDVAEAFQYMAMAGYDTEAMLSSINGTLALSIASGTGLAETTDIVTDYMTSLGLEANSTNDFVDKLAATVTSSNTTVEKYGMSMRQVASQAGALGISMTDLSTAIGLQANAGVKGAKAGTALKNVLANMAAPTKKQEKALKQLGFTADETGAYFKTTADGAVDLEATVKQLMTSTDKMTKSQKAAVLAQLAGREALPGLMALLSQGAEGWDELSNTIENSTGKVQYWNECMSLAGKSGKEATEAIENMKEVFAEVEAEALNAGLSSEELSHAIAILGDDGKVTSDNVRQLVNVIDSMNTATGDAEKKWRALDAASDDFVNTGYDYDATIAKITADTTGLSQATKESIKSKLNENMTYKEANAVLKEYGLTAERVSFSTLSYADKLEYLRDNLKGCSDEYIKNQLANLGLADSFEEVKEVVSMTDEEFASYKQNLETVQGMAEQLANAMDETTKSSLLNLASAIENVAITAFNNLKPVLKGAVDAVNEFFEIWHNFDQNTFSLDGLAGAFRSLETKIREQKGNIQQAVVDLFSGLDQLVNGGSLRSLLDMGTSVVTAICDGIKEAKNNGSLDSAIDGAIKKISQWIIDNAPQIEEAGVTIIEALCDGIRNNEDLIGDAMDALCSAIGSWASSSGTLKAQVGKFADSFADLAVESIKTSIKGKASEIWNALFDFGSLSDPNSGGLLFSTNPLDLLFGENDPAAKLGTAFGEWIGGGIQKAKEWLFGESYAAELGEEVGTQVTEGYNNKLVEGKEKTNATANEIGTGISEGIGNALLSMDVSQLQLLQTEMTNLQTTTATVATGMATSFTNIQNSARTSFTGLANIVRNQLLNCTNIVRNQALNMSNIFRNQFVNMANIARNQFVNVANIIRNQMVNSANIVRNQCVNMANIFRNQFVSMANVARNQMVNVSNIVRNQAISWSNVIRNQVTNARNSFTQQMLSMAAVARTQMVNVSNIVKNQATQWSSTIRSQAANMKSAFTSAFSGLSSIAASQMAKCLSVVRSYMSQIRAATAQKMTMSFSVNRTITTTNVTKTKTVPASASYAMRAVNNSMFALAAPTALATTSSNVSGNGNGIGIHGNTSGSLALEIPVVLDGREIARASSKYSQAELAKLEKRSKRKRGE